MPTIRELKRIVKSLIKDGTGSILLGSPGIAKSEIIKAITAEEGWGYTVHEAPSLDPTDIRGLMTLTSDKEYAQFTKSPIFPRNIDPNVPHVLVIEEITSALPSVQTSLHSLFHPNERRLGEHKLPDNVIPIAIGNYATDGAGARMLLNALKDRVMVLEAELPYSEWREDYAVPHRVHPITLGFLSFDPGKFNTFSQRDSKSGKDFVTPRTHTQISKWLYRAIADGLSDELISMGIAAYGGEGIAAQYMAFKKYHDLLPSMDKILAGENFLPKKDEEQATGILYAVCSALPGRIGMVGDKFVPKLESQHIERILEYAIFLKNCKDKRSGGAEWGEILFMDIRSRYLVDGKPDYTKLRPLLSSKMIENFFKEFKQFAPK